MTTNTTTNTTTTETNRMWTPPAGWFKAALAARQEAEDRRFRAEDNDRRRAYGLPTYDGEGSVQ